MDYCEWFRVGLPQESLVHPLGCEHEWCTIMERQESQDGVEQIIGHGTEGVDGLHEVLRANKTATNHLPPLPSGSASSCHAIYIQYCKIGGAPGLSKKERKEKRYIVTKL